MSHNSRYQRLHSAEDTTSTLGGLTQQLGTIKPTTPQDRHNAALTIAETAIAQHWTHDTLKDILDALGLGPEENTE